MTEQQHMHAQLPRLSAGLPAHVLARGLLHESGADLGFARLWQRLHDGQPITAMALGTSITAMHGGCTHSLVAGCADCCGARDFGGRSTARARPESGFLRRALEWVNVTWPHARHALYNGARPGAGGLENFVSCLSSWVPTHVDLFILEVGGTAIAPPKQGLRPSEARIGVWLLFGPCAALLNYRLSRT